MKLMHFVARQIGTLCMSKYAIQNQNFVIFRKHLLSERFITFRKSFLSTAQNPLYAYIRIPDICKSSKKLLQWKLLEE